MVTILLSPQLQSQILYLCSRAPNDEWSGSLFYKIIEGEFGDEKCVVSAEYLYLQDIGDGTYTEYQYEEDFSKFLWENQQYLDMQRGHIHSHNTMNVFFSSVDDKELIDNSKHYNYYLSLIVNNNNDMTARVAFRVVKKSTITSVLEFNDSTGRKTSKNVTESVEEKVVNFYKCQLVRPMIIDQVLSGCFDSLSKRKFTRATTFKKGQGSKKSQNSAQSQGTMWGLEEMDFALPEPQKKNPQKNKSKLQLIKEPSLSRQAYSFLVKLLNQDYLHEGNLTKTIKSLAEHQVNQAGWYSYLDQITHRVVDFYIDSYPDDTKLNFLLNVLGEVSGALEKGYKNSYPELITDLQEIFNLELHEQ